MMRQNLGRVRLLRAPENSTEVSQGVSRVRPGGLHRTFVRPNGALGVRAIHRPVEIRDRIENGLRQAPAVRAPLESPSAEQPQSKGASHERCQEKRAVRAFIAETGTNYTTALRAYDAATGHLYAKADVTESELPGSSEPVLSWESAPSAAVDTALNLHFSHPTDVNADQPS